MSGCSSPRRHIVATAVEHIGKEANRWEEQYFLGLDLQAQTEYGIAPGDRERILEILVRAGRKFTQHRLATAAGVSLSELSAVLLRKRRPTITLSLYPPGALRSIDPVRQIKKWTYVSTKALLDTPSSE